MDKKLLYKDFIRSLAQADPPESCTPCLKALWYDKNEDWVKAHQIAQGINTKDGYWIHAYLHRKEGDRSNAAYWYSRAGRTVPQISLEEEWESMIGYFLK